MPVLMKFLMTAVIITLASELAKRWSFASILLLALPLTSLLALVWIYLETKDLAKVSELSWGVFWLVPPSLVFFPTFSLLLERGVPFAISLVSGIGISVISYLLYAKLLSYFGVSF